jgi:hypothetical protein
MIKLALLASLLVLTASAGDASAQSALSTPQEPEGARQAAINSIATFKELNPNTTIIAPGAGPTVSTTGEKSAVAASTKDQLGSSLVDYTIDLNALQTWDGKDVKALLRPTGQLVYSIKSDGNTKTSVTVAKLNDQWAPISFGNQQEAEARERVSRRLARTGKAKAQPVQIRIPSLHATFLGQQINGKWQLIPIENQDALGLRAGAIEPAKKVLLRIQPAAKMIDPNTPG